MLAKAETKELIDQMPDNATVSDIMEALYFREEIKRAKAQIAAGETVTDEDMQAKMSKWLAK